MLLQLNASDSDEVETMPEPTAHSEPLVVHCFPHFAGIAITSCHVQTARCETGNPQVDEVELYVREVASQLSNSSVDAIEFWKSHWSKYPHMSKLKFNLLAIPAMSAAVERVFSQAGLMTGRIKCQTGLGLLETGCLIKYNRRYLTASL